MNHLVLATVRWGSLPLPVGILPWIRYNVNDVSIEMTAKIVLYSFIYHSFHRCLQMIWKACLYYKIHSARYFILLPKSSSLVLNIDYIKGWPLRSIIVKEARHIGNRILQTHKEECILVHHQKGMPCLPRHIAIELNFFTVSL